MDNNGIEVYSVWPNFEKQNKTIYIIGIIIHLSKKDIPEKCYQMIIAATVFPSLC